MSPKIAFRLSYFSYGGAERVFLSVAKHLKIQHGYQIDFIVDKLTGASTEKIAYESGFNVVCLGASRTILSIVPLYRYLKSARPDIVFSAYTDTNAAAILSNMINLNQSKLVITEHASVKKHWAGESLSKKALYQIELSCLYKLANHVMCVSDGMLQELKEILKHPSMSFIHNPVRFESSKLYFDKYAVREKLKIPHDVKLILSVGRIRKQKNYSMLLSAFKEMSVDNCMLYIIGPNDDNEEQESLNQLINLNNLKNNVVFVDFTEHIQFYYQAADLFVLSSAWEGFGNVIVEALAFGLPVVSTKCDFGPDEILQGGQFGKLVDVNDSLQMTKEIESLILNNPFKKQDLIKRSQAFSEEVIGEQYLQLIKKVINE